MITQLLGQTPQRLDWMAGGNNACAYLIKNGTTDFVTSPIALSQPD